MFIWDKDKKKRYATHVVSELANHSIPRSVRQFLSVLAVGYEAYLVVDV